MLMNPLKKFLRYKNLKIPHRHKVINRKTAVHFKCNHRNREINKTFNLNEDDRFFSKIIYNEVLHNIPVTTKEAQPIFLKYLTEKKCTEQESKIEPEPETEIVNFPFTVREQVLPEIDTGTDAGESNVKSDENKLDGGEWLACKYKIDVDNIEHTNRWNMATVVDPSIDDAVKFGTCDPDRPVTKIPCGGCGALLQCNDASIPGFLPKEVFETSSLEELRGELCQRCQFMKVYNVALGVHVPPAQYEQIIGSLKNKAGLVIFVVDLLDFPCSIYPEILNLIGSNKPVVVVGNKIDLLMQEDPSFLKNFQKSLLSSLKEKNFNISNIKHVALISSKTGYGVEDFITVLQQCWENQGDVYLIGCTNVGKSSLFNTLLQSDYCKVQASDILQRATVSVWPGTTLNLLKFPIAKILSWRLAARQLRLERENQERHALQKLQYLGEAIKIQQIPLSDHVGRTFENPENVGKLRKPDKQDEKKSLRVLGLDPRRPEFVFSKWCYDTPGVVHQDQILNLLTTSELLLTLPTKIVAPRNFYLEPGHSIFIGGLARLDYISGPDFAWFTVFASHNLPVTVTKIEDASVVYHKLLGTPVFRVPSEGKARLSKWPQLASKKIEICAKKPRYHSTGNEKSTERKSKEADADVVLTSAGWVAVNITPPYRCILEAWTPEGRGIHVRKTPLIKRGHIFRGQKIPKTPAFECVVKECQGYSLMDEPPF